MNKEFWYQKWQVKDIGFNQSQPNRLLQRYISLLNLKPGSGIFVPLCGQSIDMLWLAEQGYLVTGLELSPIACEAFFGDHKLPMEIVEIDEYRLYCGDRITIICGDFFKLVPAILNNIDAIYDRAALIALPNELRKQYARLLMNCLGSTGTMLLLSLTYCPNMMETPPFSVTEDEIRALYGADFDIDLLYEEPCEVPAHLKVKGVKKASEQAYLLSRQIVQSHDSTLA